MNVYVAVIQTITMFLIGIIGFFVKNTIDRFERKMEAHDDAIQRLVGDTQRLIGLYDGWNGQERRNR